MPRARDYYQVLGVARTATKDELRAAHRRLARELHPDVNKAPDASKRFGEVQEAYDVLSDDEKRRVYDQVGHEAYAAGVTGAGGGYPGDQGGPAYARGARGGTYTWSNVAGPPGSGASPFDAEDIGSIFDQFFGSGAEAAGHDAPDQFSRRARAKAPGRARGADTEHTIDVPFLTALEGGVTTLTIDRAGETETVEVTIPKGVHNGARLRLRGQGQRGRNGRGDLILTIRVGQHPVFRREGLDILADVDISIFDAALGGSASVQTPRGPVEVVLPEGAASGKKLRLRGRGVQTSDGRTGDFYAVLRIVAPERGTLTEDEKRALADMRDRRK